MKHIDSQKKYLIIAFVLLANCTFASAQNSITVDVERKPVRVQYDSSTVNIRTFKTNEINRFLQDEEFLYDRRPPARGLWETIKEWFRNWLGRASETKGWSEFWDVIIYIIIAALFIFLNREFAQSTIKGLFYKSKKNISFKSDEENIHEMDLENLIEKSYQEKNYALAVRYLYLSLLKDLNARDIIRWRIDKTNEEYVREVKDPVVQKGFKDLTLLFEYVWYGEFPLDEDTFKNIRAQFTDFKTKIPQTV